jgi:hypothetical protein
LAFQDIIGLHRAFFHWREHRPLEIELQERLSATTDSGRTEMG